ncbi:hypothetical protein C8Q80DRAFT_264049 [Daedaleopsis nitida]|nr:hypothetical protein C8Q80DRAFT_264049 [Daedaleopsis nitida]
MDDPTLYGPLYGLPDPHHPSFEGLASPQEIRHAKDTKRNLLEQQIRSLGALRNATLLINQFPNEIFVEILLMARLDDFEQVGLHYNQDGVPRTVGTSDWLPMMRVCRRWWAVARSTPRLWRSIDVYYSKEWLDLCISRSADATLELSFHDEDMTLLAIPTVISVAHRISRLLLPGIWNINFKRITPLLELQMPNLVEIGVVRSFESDFDDPRAAVPLELPPDHFPVLSILHLDGVAMPWTSTLLSNLSFLEITDCIIKDGPLTLSAFLDVLRSCTRLEELHLSEFLSEALDDNAPIPNTMITLPKLRKLTITIDAVPLLHCLRLPIDVDIFITPQWEIPGEEIFFQQYIPLESKNHIAIFQSATYGRILVHDDIMYIIAQGALQRPHGITLQYDLREHGPLEGLVLLTPFFGRALSEFSDMFASAPIDSLMLDGNTTYASQDDWRVLFSRLPKLESLTLSCTGKSLADMFRALAAPPILTPNVPNPQASQSSSVLVCPKLRAVEISGDARCSDTDLANIHRSLQLRAINGAPPLRTLWFETMHESEPAFLARQVLAAQMFAELMPDGGGRFDREK